MKRAVVWLLALLTTLGGAAHAAADGYWTGGADIYYHAVERCGGVEGRVPISLEGAAEFEKYPCPACVPAEDDGAEPRAAARDGVVVVRFSDAWLARQEFGGVFALTLTERYAGERAEQELARLLHGADYARFREAGEGTAVVPNVDGDALTLQLRHIDSAWYAIVYPNGGSLKSWTLEWTASAGRVWMENGELNAYFDRQTPQEERKLEPEPLDGSQPVFSGAGEPEVNVYEALDTYVAAIHERNPDANLLEGVSLRLGGALCAAELRGRVSGGEALYYCALTEGELAALRAGASVELSHASPAEDADFGDTPYAAAPYGTSGRMGVVDLEGNFVVVPDYEWVVRPAYMTPGYETAEPRPFFCRRTDGTWEVLDGETLAPRFEIDEEPHYDNQAVFHTGAAGGASACYRALADGSKLFDFDGTLCDRIDGGYAVRTRGAPQRMVAWRGEGAKTQACLIDNTGGIIPDTRYPRVTALYWQDGRGAYLVERFAAGEADGSAPSGGSAYTYGSAYSGAKTYGSDWRCGLIDEDGRALTELKYVSIECEMDGTIRLTGEDGAVETRALAELWSEAQ